MIRWTILFITTTFLLLTYISLGQTYSKSDFKVLKWTIKDWGKSYYINIPKQKFNGYTCYFGTAKSIAIYYTDSSSIHIMLDPSSFDTVNREFIYTSFAIKQETKLNCVPNINLTDTIIKQDTTIYSGQLSNGKLWKEISYKKVKICYINITKDKVSLYDKSIYTFRDKKRIPI